MNKESKEISFIMSSFHVFYYLHIFFFLFPLSPSASAITSLPHIVVSAMCTVVYVYPSQAMPSRGL